MVKTQQAPDGRWHALVELDYSVADPIRAARERARRAIASEVRLRQGGQHPVIRLETVGFFGTGGGPNGDNAKMIEFKEAE